MADKISDEELQQMREVEMAMSNAAMNKMDEIGVPVGRMPYILFCATCLFLRNVAKVNEESCNVPYQETIDCGIDILRRSPEEE